MNRLETKATLAAGPAKAFFGPAGPTDRTSGTSGAEQTARTDADWLAEAVNLATWNVAEGGGPFGALIVQDGLALGRGVNRVTRDNDPGVRTHCRGLSVVSGVLTARPRRAGR